MKTKLIMAVLASFFFLVACEEDYLTEDSDLTPIQKLVVIEEGTLVSEMMHVNALEGNLLGDPDDRMIRMYLPKSYYACPEKRFPVIYFLHGMPAWGGMLIDPEPFTYFYQSAFITTPVDFPEEGFIPWLNNLVDEKGMQETIIVMPDAQTRYGVCMYVNNPVLGNYEDYIVKELVKFVDQNYRTIPHFNWRAITGHCAGAIGSFNIAMKHPKVFRYVASLSASHFTEPVVLNLSTYLAFEDQMWGFEGPIPYNPFALYKHINNNGYALSQAWLPNPDNPPYYCDIPFEFVDGQPVIIPEQMEKWNSQSLFAMIQKHRIGLKQLKTVYFDCGINDKHNTLYNIMMHKELDAMHVKHQFETYDNPGTHLSNLYERLEKVWVMLSNDFPEYDD